MANPELGAKQLCPACGAKFYDLTRRPAVCPKCGESFDPEEALRTRRVRARAGAPDYEDDEAPKPAPDAEGFEDEVDDTPEIDADAVLETSDGDDDDAVEDPGAPSAPTGDLGVDFAEDEELVEEEGDDLPFIDDEDDDDFEGDIEGLPGEDKDD